MINATTTATMHGELLTDVLFERKSAETRRYPSQWEGIRCGLEVEASPGTGNAGENFSG
jgi:hypothetical protein